VGADALEGLAAGEGGDVVAGAREPRRDQAADGAEADDRGPHDRRPAKRRQIVTNRRIARTRPGRRSGKIARSFVFIAKSFPSPAP